MDNEQPLSTSVDSCFSEDSDDDSSVLDRATLLKQIEANLDREFANNVDELNEIVTSSIRREDSETAETNGGSLDDSFSETNSVVNTPSDAAVDYIIGTAHSEDESADTTHRPISEKDVGKNDHQLKEENGTTFDDTRTLHGENSLDIDKKEEHEISRSSHDRERSLSIENGTKLHFDEDQSLEVISTLTKDNSSFEHTGNDSGKTDSDQSEFRAITPPPISKKDNTKTNGELHDPMKTQINNPPNLGSTCINSPSPKVSPSLPLPSLSCDDVNISNVDSTSVHSTDSTGPDTLLFHSETSVVNNVDLLQNVSSVDSEMNVVDDDILNAKEVTLDEQYVKNISEVLTVANKLNCNADADVSSQSDNDATVHQGPKVSVESSMDKKTDDSSGEEDLDSSSRSSDDGSIKSEGIVRESPEKTIEERWNSSDKSKDSGKRDDALNSIGEEEKEDENDSLEIDEGNKSNNDTCARLVDYDDASDEDDENIEENKEIKCNKDRGNEKETRPQPQTEENWTTEPTRCTEEPETQRRESELQDDEKIANKEDVSKEAKEESSEECNENEVDSNDIVAFCKDDTEDVKALEQKDILKQEIQQDSDSTEVQNENDRRETELVKTIETLIEKNMKEKGPDWENRKTHAAETVVQKIEQLIEENKTIVGEQQSGIENDFSTGATKVVRNIEKLIEDNKEVINETNSEELSTNKNSKVSISNQEIIERIEKMIEHNKNIVGYDTTEEMGEVGANHVDEMSSNKTSEDNETEGLEMGVFEEESEESADDTSKSERNNLGPFEENGEDTDDAPELETLVKGSNSRKRKLGMADMKIKRLPNKKKLVMSTAFMKRTYFKCGLCKVKQFQTKMQLDFHEKKCKGYCSSRGNTILQMPPLVSTLKQHQEMCKKFLESPANTVITNNSPFAKKKKRVKTINTCMNTTNPVLNTSSNTALNTSSNASLSTSSNASLSTSSNASLNTTSLSKVNPSPVVESNPNDKSKPPVTRKVFLCAACHIYFEYWHLYLHMLEFHKRFICLYCLGMFGSSTNLCDHLYRNHNIRTKLLLGSNVIKLYNPDDFILTCGTCGSIVKEKDLSEHVCSNIPALKPATPASSVSCNSAETYPDPESFMLATMTEGEDGSKANKTKPELNIITLDDEAQTPAAEILNNSTPNAATDKSSAIQANAPSIEMSPVADVSDESGANDSVKKTPEKDMNATNKNDLENNLTVSDSLENTSVSKLPPFPPNELNISSTSDLINVSPSDELNSKSLANELINTSDLSKSAPSELSDKSAEVLTDKTPVDLKNKSTAVNLKSASDRLQETINEVAENRTPKPLEPVPNSLKPESSILESQLRSQSVEFKQRSPRTENSMSDAFSEFERRHQLAVAAADAETSESDLNDGGLNESVTNASDKPASSPCQVSPDSKEENKSPELEHVDTSEKSSPPVNISTDKYMFAAKVVLDKIEIASQERSSEDERSPSKFREANEDMFGNFNKEHKTKDGATTVKSSTTQLPDSLVTEDDDDDNSDNENSLKIDDSVFDDPDYVEESRKTPKEEDKEHEATIPGHEATTPSLKINPLRIKIKCSNSGDTYERIKTEVEIKEKELREKRYDEAIDEAIRKSVMEYEIKEAERLERERLEAERIQQEKDEYERLQQEYDRKQEEYQKIQEHYQKMREENEAKENEEMEEEEDNSVEEPVGENTIDTMEQDENEADNTEEGVKLVINTDEKASLLKEELLKKCEKLFAGSEQMEEEPEAEPAGVELASEDIQPMALSLDEKLELLEPKLVVKECIRTSCSICVVCFHATRVVVNGKQLALHVLAEHRYTPVKNDTTEDLINYIKNNLSKLEDDYFSSETFDAKDKDCFKPFDNVYYCFQCSFASKYQRELTSHKRKVHPKTMQICLLCKQIFLNHSEFLFHYCKGTLNANPQENIYWCGVCGLDKIPSAFRLMVHLRKKHNTCNVCLETCANESKLLQHMLKHKVIHMCYKCNISYRNKQDITKHLFWKHGTESIVCKKCLQKRWSHVYHFCQPPARFTCDECNLTFKKSVALKVHKRIHSGIFPYTCTEEGCEEKFVSKKLLEKHEALHREPPKPATPPPEESQEKAHSTSEPHIDVCNLDDSANPLQELKQEGKSKKKKKSKFDLTDNLPPLNLSSDSDSSEDETSTSTPTPATTPAVATEQPPVTTPAADENISTADPDVKQSQDAPILSGEAEDNKQPDTEDKPNEATSADIPTSDVIAPGQNSKPASPAQHSEHVAEPTPSHVASLTPSHVPMDIVPDVWDQFTSFTQAQNVFRHVEYEHDYLVVYERPPPPEEPKPVPPETPEPVANADVEQEDKSLNKTTSDDSSSDSSSSNSCGSQCGSNCSCSSSSSSSDSSSDDSSSDSDSSDPENRKKQEEKRQTKKAEKRKKYKKRREQSEEKNITIENSVNVEEENESPTVQPEPVLPAPPPINESDLDTDVSLSDEDFYDEKPQISVTKVEDKPPPHSQSPPVAAVHHTHHKPRTPIKTPKQRKRPKMRNVPTASTPLAPLTSFKHPFMQPSPAFEMKKQALPLISSEIEATPTSMAMNDDHTRSSKRKRKQNRFYGYSDDEDDVEYDMDESEEYHVKQQPLRKKLLWKPSFDKIPVQSSSPLPYENKIRIENPFKKQNTAQTPEYYDSYDKFQPNFTSEQTPPDYYQQTASQPSSSSSSSDEAEAEDPYQNDVPAPAPVPEHRPSSVPLYCYCRCPYDEVSEMIACDGDDCKIEWFHFECVNILIAPKGKWYCPQCKPKYQPF